MKTAKEKGTTSDDVEKSVTLYSIPLIAIAVPMHPMITEIVDCFTFFPTACAPDRNCIMAG